MKNMTLGARNALTRTGLVAAFLATAGVVSVEKSACADGPVRCWGWNDDGQCNTPADLGPCSSIAGGRDHTIALRIDGSVRCWGARTTVPADLGSCSSVAAGSSHSIALRSDGIVRCWGDNDYGQCNTFGPSSSVGGGWAHTVSVAIQTYVDTDGDGLIDLKDNCPGVYNPEQVDYNNNGIGDICDTAAVFELSVPEQFPTIQAAIDYAAPRGAAIRIGPGTYTDPIRLPTGPSGQSFHFQGAGAGLTVLDGEGTHEIMNGHSNDLYLFGLTFRNGFSTNHAGAVDVVTQSFCYFQFCEFVNNRLQASSRHVNDSRPRAGAVALSGSDFGNPQVTCYATFFSDNFAGGCDDCAGAMDIANVAAFWLPGGRFVRNQVEDFSSNSASCVSTRGVSNVDLNDFLVADNSSGIPRDGASNSTFRFDSPGDCYLYLNNFELRRNRVGHGGAEFAVISGDSSVLPACGTWWDVWTLLQGGSGVNLNVWEAKAQAWTNVGGARENSYLLRLRCRDGTVSTLGYSNPQVCLRARGYADLFSFCDDGIEPYWNSYINWQLFNWGIGWCYLQYPMDYEDCGYSYGYPSYYFCRSALPEDINFDRFVDGSDLAELLNNWGVCNGCGADLTANGVVDGEDLAFLLVAWGRSQ